MNRRLSLILALVLWLSAGGMVFAQGETARGDNSKSTPENILKSIPDEALGFALFNRLEETGEKVERIAKTLQIPVPPPLALLKATLGFNKGVDDKRGAALIVMRGASDERPAPIMLVPVTNYQQFVSQLSPDDAAAEIAEITVGGKPDSLVGRKGSYAAIAPRENKDALAKVLKSKSDLAGSVKPLSVWLAKNEASLVVMPAGLKILSAAALKGLEQVKQLQQAAPAPGGAGAAPAMPGVNPAMTAFGGDLFKSLPSEIAYAGVGLSVDPSNATHLTTRLIFVPGGSMSQEAKKAEPPKGDLFEHVPAQPYVFAWASSAKTSFSRRIMDLFTELMRSNPPFSNMNEAQAKQLREAFVDSAKGLQLNCGIIGIPAEKETIFSKSVYIFQVDEAAAYLANQEKVLKVMSEIVKAAKPSLITYEAKMGKLDDLPMLVMTTAMAAPPKGAPPAFTPGQQMFGPDGKLTAYIVAVDKTTVISAYGSEENARKAIAQYRKGGPGLNSDPEVAKTAALLPKGVQMIGYVSPRGFLVMVKSLLANIPLPIQVAIPDIAETPPIGLAARIQPVGLATDLIVPGEVFDVIGEAISAAH